MISFQVLRIWCIWPLVFLYFFIFIFFCGHGTRLDFDGELINVRINNNPCIPRRVRPLSYPEVEVHAKPADSVELVALRSGVVADVLVENADEQNGHGREEIEPGVHQGLEQRLFVCSFVGLLCVDICVSAELWINQVNGALACLQVKNNPEIYLRRTRTAPAVTVCVCVSCHVWTPR